MYTCVPIYNCVCVCVQTINSCNLGKLLLFTFFNMAYKVVAMHKTEIKNIKDIMYLLRMIHF